MLGSWSRNGERNSPVKGDQSISNYIWNAQNAAYQFTPLVSNQLPRPCSRPRQWRISATIIGSLILMRKWLILMDLVLLLTAAALLLIDLQIKEDIVAQAKSLQETIDGQGTKESNSIPDFVPGDLLRRDDPDNSAVASEDIPEKSTAGNRRTTGNSATRRRAGNNGTRIPSESE